MRNLIVSVCMLLFSVGAFAQTTVKGRVIDAKGESIPGVSVLEQGTSNGVTTDLDGAFTLTVQKNATLLFLFQ